MNSVNLADKKGKLLYFAEDSDTEYTFETGITAILEHPSWKLKTDDKGYFQRSFNSDDEFWDKYEVFVSIIFIGAISAFALIISAIIDIIKLARMRWDMKYYVHCDFTNRDFY